MSTEKIPGKPDKLVGGERGASCYGHWDKLQLGEPFGSSTELDINNKS